MKEADLEAMVAQWVKAHGGWGCKLDASTQRGIPDRLFLLDGVASFVEFKRPDGRGRDEAAQPYVQKLIRNSGGRVLRSHNFEEIIKFIQCLD
jgi:hypothetical protein